MKSAVLFSGGKDSTMAVYNALENGDDVRYLLAVKSANDESYMFHVPNIHLTDLLSEAMDIPIISVETDGIKEAELEDLKDAFEVFEYLTKAVEEAGYVCGKDIYFDTSFGYGNMPKYYAEKIMEKHTVDKMLFGTDSPWHTADMELRLLKTLNLSDADMEKITHLNGEKLLGI